MKRWRIILAAVIVVALCVIGWQSLFRQRTVGALPAAPAFTTTLYGKSAQVTFPGDYARKWVWLVFSGKD